MQEEGEKFAKKYGVNFIETSAMSALNVQEVTILKIGFL
jgi:hypothetical protein